MMSTQLTAIIDGFHLSIPNQTNLVNTGSPHWYISYNDVDYGIYGTDTTALVIGQGEHFLILNGNHIKAFNEIIAKKSGMTLTMCLAYIRNNEHLLNRRSDSII